MLWLARVRARVGVAWTDWRRPRTYAERLERLERVSYYVALAGYPIFGFLAGWQAHRGEYMMALTNIVFMLSLGCFDRRGRYVAQDARHWRTVATEMTRQLNALMPGVMTAMGSDQGFCANCTRVVTPNAVALQCASGHLVHLTCLVYEERRPPRCPLCLHQGPP